MISDQCRGLLTLHIDRKGRPEVARELGISKATISLILNDKYQASTNTIEAKIMAIYGNDGKVCCGLLGEISVADCTRNHDLAQRIRSAGNPDTIRLHNACRNCTLR